MSHKEKSIQIPQTLFVDLVQYFELDGDTQERHDRIVKALDDKMDRYLEHELYTKYKTAPTEEQKEKARQEYLEQKGIPKDYRW